MACGTCRSLAWDGQTTFGANFIRYIAKFVKPTPIEDVGAVTDSISKTWVLIFVEVLRRIRFEKCLLPWGA